MDRDDLKRRAERTLRHLTVEDAWRAYRAIVGMRPGSIPTGSRQALAESALAKLRNHRLGPYTTEELDALEETIRLMRPSVYVREGELPPLAPDPAGIFEGWSDFRKCVAPYLWSIGRVDARRKNRAKTAYLPYFRHVGSGFLVGDRLLATNAHVLRSATYGSNVIDPGTVRVWFKMEHASPQESFVDVAGVAGIHPSLDLALLELTAVPELDGRPSLPLAVKPTAVGDAVVTVGYPAFVEDTDAMNPEFVRVIFGRGFHVKRAAPGEILEASSPVSFSHDCSTLPGNSGSPILSMRDARVVGVHRCGRFMRSNEAIPASHLGAFLSGRMPPGPKRGNEASHVP